METTLASEDVTELQLRSLYIGMTELKGQMEKLTEAVSRLAVIEERQTNVASALERAFQAISNQGDRIRVLEQGAIAAGEKHSGTAKWVDRALVGLAGFGAAVAAKMTGYLN